MTLTKEIMDCLPKAHYMTISRLLGCAGLFLITACASMDDRLGDLSEMPSWQYQVPQNISQRWDVELRKQIGQKTPISTPKKGPIITECDQEAADPLDRNKTVNGVLIEDISIRKAIRACGYIVDEYPDIERFQYQLARAMARSGKTEQALEMLTELAENNYVAAQDILGSLYLSRARALNLPFTSAVKWMSRAAKNESLSSQWLLASLIIQGAIDPVSLEDMRFGSQTDLSNYAEPAKTAKKSDKDASDEETDKAAESENDPESESDDESDAKSDNESDNESGDDAENVTDSDEDTEDSDDAEQKETQTAEEQEPPLSEEEIAKRKRSIRQKEGIKRLSQTARAGHPGAMRRIGELLLNSQSNYGNPGLGAKYLAAAAFKEEPEAQFLFSLLLKEGYGVSRDDEEAFEWLQKSSEWGHPLAQAMLSAEYLGMTWISEDPAKAYFWGSLSAQSGLEKAEPFKTVAGEKLSDESRHSLDRLVQRWKPRTPLPDFSKFTLVDGSLSSASESEEPESEEPESEEPKQAENEGAEEEAEADSESESDFGGSKEEDTDQDSSSDEAATDEKNEEDETSADSHQTDENIEETEISDLGDTETGSEENNSDISHQDVDSDKPTSTPILTKASLDSVETTDTKNIDIEDTSENSSAAPSSNKSRLEQLLEEVEKEYNLEKDNP